MFWGKHGKIAGREIQRTFSFAPKVRELFYFSQKSGNFKTMLIWCKYGNCYDFHLNNFAIFTGKYRDYRFKWMCSQNFIKRMGVESELGLLF